MFKEFDKHPWIFYLWVFNLTISPVNLMNSPGGWLIVSHSVILMASALAVFGYFRYLLMRVIYE